MCPDCIKKDQERIRLNNEMLDQRIKDRLPWSTKEGPIGRVGTPNYMFPCEHQQYKDNPSIFYGIDPRNSQHFWVECNDGMYRSPTGGKDLSAAAIRNDYPLYLKMVCDHAISYDINEKVGKFCLTCKQIIKQ